MIIKTQPVLMKVGDLFTLTANKEETVAAGVTANGTIRVEGANAVVPGGSSAVDFTITKKNGSEQTFAATEGQASLAATTLATQSWESTAITTTNFTAGDKVKITGTLKDGRDFEILLEAGKDFEVDKNTTIATAAKNTLDNLAEALKSKDVNVVLKDGTTKEVIEGAKMTGEDLFGDKGEFTASATAGGVFKIVAKNAGKPDINAASNINTVEVKPLASAEAPLTRELPDAQGAAKSSFTFDDKLSYGAAVTVGDNTYEIMAEAINKNEKDKGTGYTADYNGSTVTVASDKIGSDQKALAVSMPYGDSVTTASFSFNPAVVKENSTLTFNDQKYEFVKKGGKASEGAVAIEVEDFAKATSKDLGDAFLAVLKNGTGSITEDGTITMRSNEVDGKIADPVLQFENYLTLQIGDTSDSYNQLRVDLADMHTKALGIDGIDIGNAEGAKAAIDVIRGATNSVSAVRGKLGAISNRLDHTSNNLSVMRENIQDAESAIRDTDIADEMMKYTKNNIFSLRRKNKINKRVKKPVFMRICGGMAPGCEECLAA